MALAGAVVVLKPAGWATAGLVEGGCPTIAEHLRALRCTALLDDRQETAFVTRLDRNCFGIIVAATTLAGRAELNWQTHATAISRSYVVGGQAVLAVCVRG
eukprot:NODE_20160_length_810_cov_3.161054.p3 GENE.NODE_20160_length_810_cov_3.161054~~NODE_20160_length_810_cov_3.161054.p3  ORF type:complete len:101 (+),score=34.25 NODE_20160_length_810_cov_3.161054:352-654(+)